MKINAAIHSTYEQSFEDIYAKMSNKIKSLSMMHINRVLNVLRIFMCDILYIVMMILESDGSEYFR